jgi:DNA-binding SARP family transcriptional activator/Tfp pilus assembly protein PilF
MGRCGSVAGTMGADRLQFRILGPLEVWRGDRLIPVRAKQRVLLAALLLQANRVVGAERLVNQLWGESPPATATATLQTHISQLRKQLQPGPPDPPADQVIVTRASGYALQVQPEQVDLHAFEQLVGAARQAIAAGDPGAAMELFRQALGLWRGPALGGVALTSPLLSGEVARLEEARLAALEDRIEAELALGRHAQLIGELEALVAEDPLRERLQGLLMVALYRSGRQARALEVFQTARRVLRDELGLEPGRALQRLQHQILTADPALEACAGGSPSPGGQPVRAVPAQLPADVGDFTGRTEDLGQLDRLLATRESTTAVVISAIAGTAGVGKTALAIHWAHRIRDRFPDGQLYVNLRGYAPSPPMQPIEALAALLNALGVPTKEVPAELDQAAGLFRTLLADSRVLVVLDNARDADQVRPLLPGSPDCLVLVTSRDRLSGLLARDGARRLTLDVLTPEEASALLARILGERRVTAEPQPTTELARACAWLPLALRIAAANLANQPRRSIASYVAELESGNRLAALAVEGDRDTAVRAALDLSYGALAPPVQRLFCLLGVAPGPDITVLAAAALSGTGTEQAARLLDGLAGAHLLSEHAPGRYSFHDLLRLYAVQRARDDPEDARKAAARRLYDWYLHTVDTAAGLLYPEKLRLPLPRPVTPPGPATSFGNDTQALAWLDAERPNLVAAIVHAAEHGPRPAAWLLADALRGYFWFGSHIVDWLGAANAALAAAQADGDLPGQAAAQLSLANVNMCQGRYQPAIEHCAEALRLNQQTGWLEGQATALGSLGLVYWELGRLQQAADAYTQALAIGRRTGRLASRATNLNNLGLVYQELGRLAQAADHYSQALELYRQLGARSNEADNLANLGRTYSELGRLDDAIDRLTLALSMHRELGTRRAEAETLRFLAEVHCQAGGYHHALNLARTASLLAQDTGYRRVQVDVLNTLGGIHRNLGEHDQAINHHQQALRLAREAETRFSEAEALIGMAAAHQRRGQLDQALACAGQAVTLARQAGYRVLDGQARTTLAELELALDRPERALEHARQALDLHRDTGHRPGQAHALLALGHALHRTGATGAAVGCWKEALALLAGTGAPTPDDVRILIDTHAPATHGA